VKARRAGELAIPLLASGYAIFMIAEQLTGNYRASTINYALLTGGAVVVLSMVIILRSILTATKDAAPPGAEPLAPGPSREPFLRGLAVFALACLLVYTFSTVGYVVGFFFFCLVALAILKVRSPLVLFAVPTAVVLVVHFLFVRWFALSLPPGLLAGFL
jgi:Tripartite tricarboxylate transporter TctB family